MSTPDRLIESTRELLWERGYVGTSPKAILEHAGAGQGSMYHHFRGKPDLALAAIRRTAEEMRAGAEAVLGSPGSPYERIEAYLRRERDVLRGCPVGRLTMDPDVVASDELRAPVDETLDWLLGRLATIVEEGKEQGSSRPRSTARRSRRRSSPPSRAATSWRAPPVHRPRSTREFGDCSPCWRPPADTAAPNLPDVCPPLPAKDDRQRAHPAFRA